MTPEFDMIGLSIRTSLLFLALLLLDPLFKLPLELAHKIVIITELHVKRLLSTLSERISLLHELLLDLFKLFLDNLIKDLVLRSFIIVPADIWVS